MRSFARLVGQLYAMCGSFVEAQDCVQEAFVRAWDRRDQLDHHQPEAWVRKVAWRLAVSRWRRARRSRPAARRPGNAPGRDRFRYTPEFATSEPPSSVELPGGVIPADFPLDVDLPDYGDEGAIEGPELACWYKEVSLCAAESFPAEIADALVDAMSVRLVAPEVEVFRGLWVFESAEDAESVLQRYVNDVAMCPHDYPGSHHDPFHCRVLGARRRKRAGPPELCDLARRAAGARAESSRLRPIAFVQLGQALLMVSDGGEGMRFEESEQD